MPTQTKSLESRSCTPCRGGIPLLNKDEVRAYLRQAPEWTVRDDNRRIERTFKFKNFAAAFAFTKLAAGLAEAEGHHPDISFGWGYATVSLQTKKIKGLHENDFIMAAKLNRLVLAGRTAHRTGPKELTTTMVASDKQLTYSID
jgi:4a-hydroxytetrahydrobiopterin dehydratase